MKKLGFIINPVAGVGGRVGLKGSDGPEIQKMAQSLGAVREARNKAVVALKALAPIQDKIELWTAPGEMGEDCAGGAGFPAHVIGRPGQGLTTAADTIHIARQMAEIGVDLLVFAGGDGTARDIYAAVGEKLVVLGIPAGVKIHSGVYAVNPTRAGEAALLYLSRDSPDFREAEVMDIDEEAFRAGRVRTKLYGYLKVPELKAYIQNVKAGGYSEPESLAGIAAEITGAMREHVLYIIGPGTTTRSIMDSLGLAGTLLGVDVVRNRQLLAKDVNERQLYELLQGGETEIIVTAIGGQGHIFGRGNQQISPRIIRKAGPKNIHVVASKAKLINLLPAPLLVDTGDSRLDKALCGYIRVITGWGEYIPYAIST
jgi:predicted polyphosphate/ATP-dependent NAD kinase